jgi:hypothetical protein
MKGLLAGLGTVAIITGGLAAPVPAFSFTQEHGSSHGKEHVEDLPAHRYARTEPLAGKWWNQ